MRRFRWFWLLALALALLGYYQSWYAHDTAAFSMHGYDLAEWASLHPAVRSETPTLMTSFLLRWSLVAWALVGASLANAVSNPRGRWFMRLLVLLVLGHFVPPADFLSTARNDPNYRQMALFVLLGVGGVGGMAVLGRFGQHWQAGATLVVCLSGMGSAWWGMSRTDRLLANFQIDVTWGVGLLIYLGAMAWIAVSLGWRSDRKSRASTDFRANAMPLAQE